MTNPAILIAVGFGGAVGALARFGTSRVAARLFGADYPWGTLLVNIGGSFLMGVIIAWLSVRAPATETMRSFLVVGLLGSFTTFSTFSLDVVTLIERKAYLGAAGYLTGSVLLSIAGLLLGMFSMRAVL